MNSGLPSLTISQAHLWLIFAVALALFVVMSLILFYHWRRYRVNNAGVVIAGTIYLVGSAILIAMALTALTI